MSLIDIILLAVALAMDCLTVSIVSGVIINNGQWTMDNGQLAARSNNFQLSIFNCQFSWSEVDAVEIHLTCIRRCLTCQDGALYSQADFDVALVIVTCWQVERFSQYDGVHTLGIACKLGVAKVR